MPTVIWMGQVLTYLKLVITLKEDRGEINMDVVMALILVNADRVQRDNIVLRIRRRIRDTSNPFALPENEFRSLYR